MSKYEVCQSRCRAAQPRPRPLIARGAIDLAAVHFGTRTVTCSIVIVDAVTPLATRAGVAAIVAPGTGSRNSYMTFWCARSQRPQPLIALDAIELVMSHLLIGTVTCLFAIVNAAFPLATRAGVAAFVARGTECRDG